jgi:cellulose biosynthesis protein BcsQ
MIVTFYSYKGGTGRTMALANIACLLSARGKKVLIVDFDLEAPGLRRYFERFHSDLDQCEGMIDLLTAAYSASAPTRPDWRSYVTEITMGSASVSLMTSGKSDSYYAARVLEFDWTAFFLEHRGGEFIEEMRTGWKSDYDFVLIDSRTGITDIGGICTIQLPDMIVPVFITNIQSITGIVEIISRAQARRGGFAYDRPPAIVLPLLSRFDGRTEFEAGQEWLDRAANYVGAFYEDWLPTDISPREALERTKLPYVAYFSFGETLPALTQGVSDPDSLGYALDAIAQLIEEQLRNADIVIGGRPSLAERSSVVPIEAPYQARNQSTEDATKTFRDREHELEAVIGGLRTTGGNCFWLVTGPPQLGKSWFIKRVSTEAAEAGWTTSLVDVREQSAAVRTDVSALLGQIFGIAAPSSTGPETQHRIAVEICRAGRPLLCLLDSAELLHHAVAADLRSCVSGIYREVEQVGNGAQLGFVVASRRVGRWRSATDTPRFSVLPLSEFSLSIVQQALADLASAMNKAPYIIDLRPIAALVYQATEGLPALLTSCLNWIQEEQWLDVQRLFSQSQFELLAGPYIADCLFARDSLFSESVNSAKELPTPDAAGPMLALEQVYRILAPYRFFTQSHVRYRLENDSSFRDMINYLGWSLEDLWNAISEAALLMHPLDEPWHEIHPAIRRLLYRYFYKTPEERALAHQSALKFVKVWGLRQFGKEQIVGLVECLWHEAMALSEGHMRDFEQRLTASAVSLSLDLKPSPLYTIHEVRNYASERIRNDDELSAVLDQVHGLRMRLPEIVRNPPQPPVT